MSTRSRTRASPVELQRCTVALRVGWQELAHLTEAHGVDLHARKTIARDHCSTTGL